MYGLNQTKIIAHRGYSDLAPENTLAAFALADSVGADFFELDVHRTADDSIVCIHDKTVDRTSSNGAKGEVAEMTYEELSKVHVGYSSRFGPQYKDETIPTLRETLVQAKGKIKVCIEIKVEGIEKQVLNLLHELDMVEEVMVFAFSETVIEKFRQLNKDVELLYLVAIPNNQTIFRAKEIGANAVGVGDFFVLNEVMVDFAHEYELMVFQWTINDPDRIKKLLQIGVDGIITDRAEEAVNLKEELFHEILEHK